jgi:hypothetical protein
MEVCIVNALQHLVAEAVALGGGDLCAAGHDWQSVGGTQPCDDCPIETERAELEALGAPSRLMLHGRAVYQCERCGAWDYGDRGGPGHADCVKYCRRST